MERTKYQHVFFDLDHTLWDFEKNSAVALAEIFKIFALAEKLNTGFDSFNQKYQLHNKQLWDRFSKGFISAEELKWKRMWRTLLEFELADETLAKEMSHGFLDILPTEKEVFPYTFEILDYLKTKKYDLHIISNGFEKTQHSKLTHSGLKDYFNQVITSEASNAVKPQKEIFEFAMEKAGAQLHESIMIGDNAEADIAGAIAAGMDSVFVSHDGRTTDLPATFSISHLKELEDIL